MFRVSWHFHSGEVLNRFSRGGHLGFQIRTILAIFSSPEHEVLMVSYSGQSMSVVHRAALTIALKAYSYTPRPIDFILGRKHRGDL